MSLWERYKLQLYRYGHIYATIFGLVAINYTHTHRTANTAKTSLNAKNRLLQCLRILYSYLLNFMLIVVLPVYFGWNIRELLHSNDARFKLLLLVSFVNTCIKYVTVIVTYIANLIHYDAIRDITRIRQQIEDELQTLPVKPGTADYEGVRQHFERFLLSKFVLINSMIFVQLSQIIYLHHLSVVPVRVQYAWYSFVLWNYTENMANYFYFIKCSIFKFYRQLNVQLLLLLYEMKNLSKLQRQRKSRQIHCGGLLMELCNCVCDRLDVLALYFDRIYKLYGDSVSMHQFQILGIVLTALLSNLTNCFALFNMLYKQQGGMDRMAYWMIVFNLMNACIFYMDTTIVSLANDVVCVAQREITETLACFTSIPTLDVRLNQTLENFMLKLLQLKPEFYICGLFNVDKHLIFLIASTTLTYFITLVQFDMNLYGKK